MYLFLVFSDIHTLMASTLPRNTGIVEICTVIHAQYRQRTPHPLAPPPWPNYMNISFVTV